MHNITYKNEKSIRRVFKQPFKWAVLTVLDENGYHKIALKKNLFRKTYTISYVVNDKLCTEKREVSLEDLANNNISIAGFGNLHIEDICVSLTDPSKIVESEEKIYSKINSRARKEEQEKKLAEEKKRKEEEQKRKEAEKQREEEERRIRQKYLLDNIANLGNKVMYSELLVDSHTDGFYETNKCIRNMGCEVKHIIFDESYKIKKSYDLKFVINELIKYSEKIGFTGFDDNGLLENLSNIKIKENVSFEEAVRNIYISHGILVSELYIRTIELCKYIRENNVDISQEVYENYYSTSIKDGSYSEKEGISDFVNELIKSVSCYIERVTGTDYSSYFKNELEAHAKTI